MKLRFDLDKMIINGQVFPIRSVVESLMAHGVGEGIYDTDAEKLSETALEFLNAVQDSPLLELDDHQRATMLRIIDAVGEYADRNNYGSPSEDIEADRIMGQTWRMVRKLLHPNVFLRGIPENAWPMYGVTVVEG